MAAGRVIGAWSALETESFVEQAAQRPHYVLARAVLAHSERVEDDMIDQDDGSATYRARDCEFVGITRASDGDERIHKYYTLVQARLAVQAHRDAAAPT